MTEYKAIAIKEKPKSLGEKGVVKLLFIWDEDKNNWVVPDEVRFKARKCFITTDYSKEIDERYKRDEPFVLKKVNENFNDQDKQGSEYAEWRCFGNQNERLSSSEFIPVIKGDLPGQEYGELKLDVAVQYIFIENNDFIYGPFQLSFDEKIIATPHEKPLGLQQYHLIKVSKESLRRSGALHTSIVDGNEYCFIASYANLRSLKNPDWEIDYINNSALMKYVLSVSKKGEKQKNIRTKQEISSIQSDIKEIYGKAPQSERVRRALDLLASAEQKLDSDIREFESLVNEWMGSENGRRYVIQLSEERDKLNKEIEELKGKAVEARDVLAKTENRSNILKGELQDLRKNIDELTHQKITLGEEQKRRSLEEADQKFKEREAELSKVEAELNGKLKNLKSVNSLEEIEEEEKSVKRNIKKLEEEQRQLKSDIEASQGVLSKQNLRNVIIEHDSLLKILKSGGVVEEQQNIIYTPIKLVSKSIENDLANNKETLIKAIAKKLNSNDKKKFEEYEIANLLICTQQNLLTILQGTPGSGKTSTAIGLAKALGLCDESESTSSHFLNIAVARGWVSSRDILGYYNSLKGSYQPAKTGLYQFLLMGEDSQSSEAPMLILLDEANLSPIEHYWSDFIGMCDTEGFYRSIDTGAPTGQKQLTPNRYDNLRFIATINSDETTEPLSPRLLDRAPVINMDIPHSGFFENADEFELDGALRIDLMKKFFGTDESKRKEINEYPRLNKFIELASKNDKTLGDSINLSMRKRNSISNYLSVAMEIMEESCAQDYAISQFVLPLLKGDKKGFSVRLEKLKEIAIENEFERSKNIVDGILESGDQYLGNYSFF